MGVGGLRRWKNEIRKGNLDLNVRNECFKKKKKEKSDLAREFAEMECCKKIIESNIFKKSWGQCVRSQDDRMEEKEIKPGAMRKCPSDLMAILIRNDCMVLTS